MNKIVSLVLLASIALQSYAMETSAPNPQPSTSTVSAVSPVQQLINEYASKIDPKYALAELQSELDDLVASNIEESTSDKVVGVGRVLMSPCPLTPEEEEQVFIDRMNLVKEFVHKYEQKLQEHGENGGFNKAELDAMQQIINTHSWKNLDDLLDNRKDFLFVYQQQDTILRSFNVLGSCVRDIMRPFIQYHTQQAWEKAKKHAHAHFSSAELSDSIKKGGVTTLGTLASASAGWWLKNNCTSSVAQVAVVGGVVAAGAWLSHKVSKHIAARYYDKDVVSTFNSAVILINYADVMELKSYTLEELPSLEKSSSLQALGIKAATIHELPSRKKGLEVDVYKLNKA